VESFLHSVSSVAIILLLTGTGYFCAAKGWLKAETKAFISKFLMTVAIPAMIIYSSGENLSLELLRQSGPFLLIPFLTYTSNFILSFIIGKLLHLPRKRIGVFMLMCSLSNALFIGYAMCQELFGEACTPYVMLFWLVSSCYLQLFGIPLIRWCGGEEMGFSAKTVVKFLKTPAILAIIVGITLVLLEIQLPSLVISYCRYLNGTVTPLALLLTGYLIYEIGLKGLRLDRDIAIVLLFRFLISPAICVALCAAFGVTGFPRSVLLVQSAMPVVTQSVVSATEYGADAHYAAQGAAISTLASFAVIPILMMII